MDLKTILEYSPYDNKRVFPYEEHADGKTNTQQFDEDLFVEYPSTTRVLVDSLCKSIDDKGNSSIIFYGASGSGKTTFLNYFAHANSDNYNFHFVNLIENPTPMENDQCIREILLGQLYNILDADNGVADKLHDRVVVDETLVPFVRKSDNDILINYLGSNYFERCDSEDYLRYVGLDEDGNLIPSSNRSLLVLYIIAELIRVDNSLNQPHKDVFIFDNLDEIPTQYIISHTYNLILSAYSIVQQYCKRYTKYDFLGNSTFILSYRSTNAQIIDRNQRDERISISSVDIEFRSEYQVSYTDIYEKRLSYYQNHLDDNSKMKSPNMALKILRNERFFCLNVLRPLFNYDYRMYTHFFILHLLDKGIQGIDESLCTDERNSIKQSGSRGILLFNAMQSMMKDPSLRFVNYVRHEFEDDARCNIYRMSFTLLSNLGGWSLNDTQLRNAIKEENNFIDETPRISFYLFLKRIEKWYGKSMVKIVIDGLIGSVAYNFEYPITLVGGAVDDFFRNDKVDRTISGLVRYIIEAYDQNESILSNVYVKINPLCVIYAWRIFINFEYFNLISTQWNNPSVEDYRYSPIPLFNITNEHVLKGCLDSVYSTVVHLLQKAETHFCNKCQDSQKKHCNLQKGLKTKQDVASSIETCKETFDEFNEDGFCINNTMYATRVITSHLNYIDKYKTFIWGKCKDDLSKQKTMQMIILNQMDKYIELWDKRRVVEEDTLLKQYQYKIQIAKNELINNNCISIELEKGEQSI